MTAPTPALTVGAEATPRSDSPLKITDFVRYQGASGDMNPIHHDVGYARKAGYDLLALKERYPTAGYEMIALRMLELDEPCVIAIVDDGVVSARRGNRSQATKKLTPAEVLCLERIGREGDPEPQTARRDGWTVRGWPVPSGPFTTAAGPPGNGSPV